MFDSLKYAGMLEEAGFSRDQAETSIKILIEIMEDKLASKQDFEDLREDFEELRIATKHDIEGLKVATRHDIEELKIATRHDIEELKIATRHDIEELKAATKHDFALLECRLKSELTIRMGVMFAASITLLTAIMSVLHKYT